MLIQLAMLMIGLTIPTSIWLLGSGRVAGWWVGIGGEVLWLLYTIFFKMWGMVPSSAVVLVVKFRGLSRWHELAHNSEKPELEVT